VLRLSKEHSFVFKLVQLTKCGYGETPKLVKWMAIVGHEKKRVVYH
jgi:hypothetical protein